MVLVKPLEPLKIFDLDNMVAFEDRTVIGFVIELVGPVTRPLYSI
jgi:rRNA processing protein Gar1